MEFRLLGPVEVMHGGQIAALGGPRQRAVLAQLALAAPETVSTERLVDGLWGEDPPAKPLPTLQVFIHKLRKALAGVGDNAGLLESRPGGYRLAIDHHDTDVGHFLALAERARAQSAAGENAAAHDTLREALDLWRGPCLADVRDAPFTDAEAARLEELRLLAEEDRVDLAMRLGRHAQAVAALEEHVRAHPTRERLWAQLMVALYRSDRQADALAAYGRARDQLAEELGIDPGQALQQLELGILRQDPALAAPLAVVTASWGGGATTPVAPAAPRPAARVPRPLTPTIGREELVAQVVATATRDEVRVVSLTGLGGTGKSRVASVAATAAAVVFGEAVYYLAATELTDSDQLAREAAVVTGAEGAGDPYEALATVAEPRPTLLVLDNLEAVPDGDGLVRRLVEAAPHLTVLVTSRVPVRLAAEHEIAVPPLEVPAEDATTDEIATSPAVLLFSARASAASTSFRLGGNERAVADLCRFLDGVPLALELAAARVRLLSVERILTALRTDLDLLTTSAGDVPERQRTLTRTIAWSYDRLDGAGQLVCDRLALFERGFTIEALEAVCPDVPSVIESLGAILDARLVRSVETRVEVRFVVLGTVRAFVRSRLGNHDDLDERRGLLAAHLLELVEAWSTDLHGEGGAVALGRFDDEAADIDATIDWAVATGRATVATDLTLAALDFWVASGSLHEGLRRTELVRDSPGISGLARGRLTVAAAQLAYHLTDWSRAELESRAALGLAEAGGDDATAATARCYLGASLVVTGRADEGAALARRALVEGEALGLYPLPAVALSVVAISHAVAGDADGERESYLRRLHVVRRHGDLARIADTLNTLAEIALDEADAETAEEYAAESLEIAGPRLPLETRDALITLARAAAVRASRQEAVARLEQALVLADRTGQSLALAQCLRVGGCIAVLQDDSAAAVRLFAAAQSISPSPGGTEAPVEQDLAQRLSEAREDLGEPGWRREWTMGGALPVQSARVLLARVLGPLADQA